MENEDNEQETADSVMRKHCEAMPDGTRYIIYYTFGKRDTEPLDEVAENV